MGCGKLPAAGRGAGLIENRRALRRGFAEMDRLDPVLLAAMTDLVDLGRVGVNVVRTVEDHGASSQLPSHSRYMTSIYSSARS